MAPRLESLTRGNTAAVEPAAGRQKMNILVVEDHANTRSLLERMLSGWGHEVAAAGDLRTGLGFLQSDRFDAIVSDIALPDGTGYALIDTARRNGIKAIAVAISAFPYPPDVHEPKVTGFDHHLSKPFTPEQLRGALEQNAPPAPPVEQPSPAVSGGAGCGSTHTSLP